MAGASLKAIILNCTLKSSPVPSSTEKLAKELLAEFKKADVDGSIFRVADYDVRPGVAVDMGDGDQWPEIRNALLAADILIIATPIWMGQMSSFAQRIAERLDAELSEKDDNGRPLTYRKVAGAVVVGNEDGAHHVSAILFQVLNDVGFSLAPGAVTYWNGEAMHTDDYKDLPEVPETVASTTHTLAVNTAQLARLLKSNPYPAR